jgi:hypothetical protein
MQNILKSVLTLVAGLAIAASIGYGVYTLSGIYAQQVENEARFQCAQSSRYSVNQGDNTQVWYPVEEMYQKCLTEKGIN